MTIVFIHTITVHFQGSEVAQVYHETAKKGAGNSHPKFSHAHPPHSRSAAARSEVKVQSSCMQLAWVYPVCSVTSVLPSFSDGHMYDLSTIPRVSYLLTKTCVWCSLTCLSSFQIFMQADFSLEDPPTFQDVLPLSQLLPLGRKKPAETQQDTLSSKLLHERVGGLTLLPDL